MSKVEEAKEKIEKNKELEAIKFIKEHKLGFVLGIGLVLGFPYIINWIYLKFHFPFVEGNANEWISFLGNYSGGILGGIIAYMVARMQIKNQIRQNDLALKKDQIKYFKFYKDTLAQRHKSLAQYCLGFEDLLNTNSIDNSDIENFRKTYYQTLKSNDGIKLTKDKEYAVATISQTKVDLLDRISKDLLLKINSGEVFSNLLEIINKYNEYYDFLMYDTLESREERLRLIEKINNVKEIDTERITIYESQLNLNDQQIRVGIIKKARAIQDIVFGTFVSDMESLISDLSELIREYEELK